MGVQVPPPTPQVRRDKCSGWLPSLDRSSALYRAFIARFDLEHVTFGHESRQSVRQRPVSVLGGVLVPKSGSGGGMTRSVHEFGHGGTSSSRPSKTRVSEIVEAEISSADLVPCVVPSRPERPIAAGKNEGITPRRHMIG